QQTTGRATIYKRPDGEEYLRLSDFKTARDESIHVFLGRSSDSNLAQGAANGGLDGIYVGPLKGNQGDQNYDLPATADLNKYDAVIVYSHRAREVYGLANLEQF